MIRKDAFFPAIGSTAYGVDGLQLLVGVEVTLDTDHKGEWFFNNDSVMKIDSLIGPDGSVGKITALEEGESRILFLDGNNIVDSITIIVTSNKAASLGLTSGSPEPK